MTNDALKEKALEAGRSIVVIVNQELAIRGIISTAPFDIDTQSIEFSDAILANLQPLIDADRQETERYEKALRFYADKENYNKDIPGCNDGMFWICDGGNTARTALGEEK